MDIEQRLTEIERRLDELEGIVPAREPMLSVAGFVPGERVELGVLMPNSVHSIAGGATDADVDGVAHFLAVRVHPSPAPERRVFEAKGQTSGRVIEQPIA